MKSIKALGRIGIGYQDLIGLLLLKGNLFITQTAKPFAA